MADIRSYYDQLPEVVRTTLWSAARAFIGAFIVLAPGVLYAPDFNTGKAALIAAVIAGGTAAIRVIQHALQGTLTS